MGRDSAFANFAGWPEVTLAEITTKIGSGATPRGGSQTYLDHRMEYALIRSQNVFDRRFDRDGLAYITNEQANALRNVVVQRSDVLLNITGDGVTFGRSCIVPDDVRPACVNQHVSIIRVDPEKADAGYVLSFLTHPEVKAYIESFNAGGSRRAITKGHIESFRLALPPLPIQRAIARILGALDDKIELNRKMSATLEAMARALFHSWFVDFDPVRAKAEGRIPHGMDAATAALFPSEFEESELGLIPRGWSVVEIGELASIAGGATPSTGSPAFWTDGIHSWATPKDLSRLHTPVLSATERRVTDQGLQQISSGLLPIGTVLLSSRAPIGYLAVTEIPVAINQGFIAMKPKSDVPSQFLLLWAHAAKSEILARANGSTFLEISKTNFKSILVPRPSGSVLAAFDRITSPLYRAIVANEGVNTSLIAMRDELLPRLLSGELVVDELLNSQHAEPSHD